VDTKKPVPAHEIVAALTSGRPLGAEFVPWLCPGGVMGSLQHMPLTETLQSMDFSKKTAILEVFFNDDTGGIVHVHDGQIVRAEAKVAGEPFFGEQAFLELCRRSDGSFHIDYARASVERNVQRPTTFVLLEALRVIDEARASSDRSTSSTSSLSPSPASLPSSPMPAGPASPWDLATAPVDDPFHEPTSEFDIDVKTMSGPVVAPRYPVELPVELQPSDDQPAVLASLEEVGLDGAFISTGTLLARAARVKLRINANTGKIVAHAHVHHVLDATAAASLRRHPGVGVLFEPLSKSSLRALHALVEQLSADPARQPKTASENKRERLIACVREAEFLIAVGDPVAAQRVLQGAHGIAPEDDVVRRRLMKVNEAIDAGHANALLDRALRGAPDAVDLARRATQLRPSRDVFLRSLGVFARAQAHDDIADVAEQLLELDPADEGALRTLLDANRSLQRWDAALNNAAQLVRIAPADGAALTLLAELQRHAARAR
jgi:hypothetical protein